MFAMVSELMEYNKDYPYSICILLYLYFDNTFITAREVYNNLDVSLSQASNILRRLWQKGRLIRVVDYDIPHGRKFVYELSQSGYDLLYWLKSKGIVKEDLSQMPARDGEVYRNNYGRYPIVF
jgi:hypothetical protein